MNRLPGEAVEYHTSLVRCTLEAEDARAYWQHRSGDDALPNPQQAYGEYWFGVRSLDRVKVLLSAFRERFDAFPPTLRVLAGWVDMPPQTRRLICHWHVQLADPLYRAFTGEYLVERRAAAREGVTRDLVVRWIEERVPGRWSLPTRLQFARKLLQTAAAAGLLGRQITTRPFLNPTVDDRALAYLLYALRGIHISGSLVDNPYLASVGLQGPQLDRRMTTDAALRFRRQGSLWEFGWQYDSLLDWAAATVWRQSAAEIEGVA